MSKYHSCLLFLVILAVLLAVLGNRFSFPPDQAHAQAAETLPEEKLDRKIENFFHDLTQAIIPTNTVFEDLFQEGLQTPRTSPETVKNMSEKFAALNNSGVGQIHGCEKIESKQIGKDVIILKYLSKHDNAPVKWSFTFYRSPQRTGTSTIGMTPPTNADWNVILVSFDTNLE